MSIRGIDSQIMITRSPDVARDASAIQKRPEVTQDYQAIATKVSDAHDQKRVKETSESEMERLHADKDGSGNGKYSGEGGDGSGKDNNNDDTEPGLLVAPGNNKIDIRA